MNSRIIRIISLLLSIVLLLVAFISCGKDTEGPKDGRVTERAHNELLAANGTYKELYALQFRDNDIFE